MGSSRTFTWQCIALVAIVVVFALVAPVESKFWVMLTGLAAAAFFIVVSLARHQQIKRLAGEIDEVLHNGRRIDFSTSSEGDVAVLTNELQKMVARLARTTEQLEAFVMRGDHQARDRAARACARLARCEPGGGS